MDLSYLIVLAAATNFLLGLLVYFKDRRKRANVSFALFAWFLSLWCSGLFLYEHPLIFSSLVWIKMVYLCALMLVPTLFYFSFVFLEEASSPPLSSLVLYALLTVPMAWLLIFSKLFIKNVIYGPEGYQTLTGPIYLPFAGVTTFYTSWALLNFARKYRSAKGTARSQLHYLFLGIFLVFISALIVDAIIPITTGTTRYFWLSAVSSIFLVTFTSFAITKYHLFEIKVILTELLVGTIGVITVVQALLATSLAMRILGLGVFLLFCTFGYFLIKATHQEIRRRKEMEKLYRELKKLDKAKSEFVSIASHQLRTPLTAIKGFISMVARGAYGQIPRKAQKPMENVYQSNERLIKLVDDLLSVSRIETGKLELKPKRVSLEDMISSVVKELRVEAEEKGLYLRWKKPEKALPKILADKDKVRQALSNVIDNAIKYTERGGVTVEPKRHNSSLKIKVSDTGVGLTKEELPYLFESFSRGKAGVQFWPEGIGLGLYIARRFVEMHHGKIWAESPGKGKGSTFYIELPVK